MAANAELGRVATIEVDDIGGSTYIAVGQVQDPDLALNFDVHDVTNNDSGIWKEDLRGHGKASLSFSCVHDPADVGQEKLIANSLSGAGVLVRYRESGGDSGDYEYEFPANVTTYNVTASTQGARMVPFSLESCGTVTRTAIP